MGIVGPNCPNPTEIQVSGGPDYRGTNILKSSSHLTYSTPPHKWMNIFLGFLERYVQTGFQVPTYHSAIL